MYLFVKTYCKLFIKFYQRLQNIAKSTFYNKDTEIPADSKNLF